MSEVKVNKISPRSGTTVTLGDSGDTFTIPSGATINNQGTATNFGATGSASWVTTVKTSTFTAVAGEGYFVNTTGGAVSVNLPAGTAGAVVAVKDYANTFDTNACTLVQNGSDKIGGASVNAVLNEEGVAVTLVFVDSTQGWLVTDSGLQSEAPTAEYICASVSGSCNTIATSGDFKVATFKGPGTFTVNSVGNSCGSDTVDYLVVAGGGGGGNSSSGPNGAAGGGAGGFRVSNGYGSPGPTMSPLSGCVAALPVTATGYPITVGGGGAASPGSNAPGSNGVNSVFTGSSTITSAGGGFGSGNQDDGGTPGFGGPGGSGGGGHQGTCRQGVGNTPPVSPPQGNDGGKASSPSGNGGGGAGAIGGDVGGSSPYNAGCGGIGSFVIQAGFGGCNGTPGPVSDTKYFAGGGGGSNSPGRSPNGATGVGGSGGGGNQGSAGTANTGGGGGAQTDGGAGAGGSGIVIIRYKFQN